MRLVSEDMIHVGNKIYMFANNMNMLYSIDTNTGSFELLGMIPGKQLMERRLIASILEWEGYLFLLPLNPGNIWVYSLSDHNWKQILLDFDNSKLPKTFFKNAVIADNKMYMFGGHYPAVVILNLHTLSLKYDFEPFKDVKCACETLFFRGSPVQIEDFLYVASAFDNSILKYDILTGNFAWIEIGDKRNKYAGIEWDGNSFWLAPRTSDINVIKVSGESIEEIILPTDGKRKPSLFIGMCRATSKLVIPAADGDYGTAIVGFDGKVEITDNYYSVYKAQGNEILAQYKNGDIVFCDDKKGLRTYNGEISSDLFSKMLTWGIKPQDVLDNRIMMENEPLRLKEWLGFLKV